MYFWGDILYGSWGLPLDLTAILYRQGSSYLLQESVVHIFSPNTQVLEALFFCGSPIDFFTSKAVDIRETLRIHLLFMRLCRGVWRSRWGGGLTSGLKLQWMSPC